MEEIWKDVKGYEDLYEVSNFGNLRNKDKTPKKITNNRGYYVAKFCKGGVAKQVKVHRLVGEAFIPNPENKPFINHIDCNTLNNLPSNLEWCTPAENSKHAKTLDRFYKPKGELNSNVKLTEEVVQQIRCKYVKGSYGFKRLAKEFNLSPTTICGIIQRKDWKHI